MTTYPPAPLQWQNNLLLTNVLSQVAYVGYEGTTFHVMGPLAPVMGAQSGVVIQKIAHLDPGFKHLDNKGARQDGVTWYDSLYDPAEITMVVKLGGVSASDMRNVTASWFGAWDARQVGQLCWWTPERGEWVADVRLAKPVMDTFERDWYQSKQVTMTWIARNDNAFWRGVDSICSFPNGNAQITLTNTGDQPAWPRYLVYGPGTFYIQDYGTGNYVSFGPLASGQIMLLNTMPRLTPVVDLSPTAAVAQNTTALQHFVQLLTNFATSNNVPPLLQKFESLFGIVPPQGPAASLLGGRFTQPIPAMLQQQGPTPAFISCGVVGGGTIVAALTPYRRWPE